MWYFGLIALICSISAIYIVYASDAYEWQHPSGWLGFAFLLVFVAAICTSAFCNTLYC